MSDTVDLDLDLDNFDYGELDDINPDDLDIDNLERELGLVNDIVQDKDQVTDDSAKADATAKAESSLTEKPKDRKEQVSPPPPERPATPASPASKPCPPSTNTQDATSTTAAATTAASPTPTRSTTTTRYQEKTTSRPSMPQQQRAYHPYQQHQRRTGAPQMAQQYPFNQGMMGMNMMMMMPSQQPGVFPPAALPRGFPGTGIHINPKFAASRPELFGAPASTHITNAPAAAPSSTAHALQQDALQKQRQLILEQQRKRRERKAAEMDAERAAPREGVYKRKFEADHHDDGRADKRPSTGKGIGISIKGAAAAAAAASTASQYTPVRTAAPIRKSPVAPHPRTTAQPAILSRVGNHKQGGDNKRPAPEDHAEKQRQPIPISTSGKSSKLVISNLNDAVTEAEIRQLAQDVPGGINGIDINRAAHTATAMFSNPEAAVIFRRKFNRTLLGGNHIVVSFAT